MYSSKTQLCQANIHNYDEIPEIQPSLKRAIKRVKLPSLTQNLDDARILYEILGGGVQCFQIFPESKVLKSKSDKELAQFKKHRHGTFDELQSWLVDANNAGCGVYIVINETDGKGRKIPNITAVRGAYVDMDGAPLEPVLQVRPKPHIITETSPGHYHPIWLVSDCPLEMFRPIQTALAQRFDCEDKVGDLPHVMRMPGFGHWKHQPVLSKIYQVNPGPPYSIHEIISGLKLTIPNPNSQEALRDENTRAISSSSILWAVDNNELGDSELFQRLMKGRYCFDHAAGTWMKWTGHYWAEDDAGDVVFAMGEVVDLYEAESERQAKFEAQANREDKKDEAKKAKVCRDKLLKRIRDLQTVRRIKDITWLSYQGEQSLGISGQEWDQDPWLLGVANGVIELKDGSFRPGQQTDFIKTVAPTEWQGLDAKCLNWDEFLSEIIVDEKYNPDPETVNYVHRTLGCSITGTSAEHTLPILWGERGRNGKSTKFEVLAHVLGPLAGKIPSETLLSSSRPASGSGPKADLMFLRGKRLVWANETDRSKRLDVSRVKELSGGDTISARNPFGKKLVTFKPTHTIFLLTNDPPRIPTKRVDPVWDRVSLIPFYLKYVDEPTLEFERKKDTFLTDKLKKEASGILAWLVRGCLEWQTFGLKKSQRVLQATLDYQDSEDTTGRFIKERCKLVSSDEKTQASKIYKAYCDWCVEQNIKPLNGTTFGKEMSHKVKKQDSNKVVYLGITLSHSDTEEEKGSKRV
ncbi:MAG: phage/plasmid primase, P4 family [Deltaproteobacteria bacterium]|nr:phage/plasmid primase, P4 family [Deltaproteobacteria bacterium]